MSFLMRYPITVSLLTPGTKRRSGRKMDPVRFIVAHDTGNPGSTARNNVRYYENSRNTMSASAHYFADDKEIIECIPVLSGPPEKAWHVLYNKPKDNQMFGADANDAAIGVEYCYGGTINANESYKRYVWLIAYLCHKFQLDPARAIVGHHILDPGRKTDPKSGLAASGRTYEQLLLDIVTEYHACLNAPPVVAGGEVRVKSKINIRKGAALTSADIVRTATAGEVLRYVTMITDGQSVSGNSHWYKDAQGNYFWAGGVEKV
jgi:N-acetylmuramoyl-L-alanine amidase